jgi:[NiFe] hydrogenase assembly HybE family chaperone
MGTPLLSPAQRAAQLELGFASVAPRMRALGLARSGLQVQAVDFRVLDSDDELLLGVLITPWCLNLVLLPQCHCDRPSECLGRPRELGGWALEFQTAALAEPGAYASCGLFSDMARFADQAAAVVTAQACLEVLRKPASPAQGVVVPPSRRGFLFGGSSSASVARP